MPVYPESLKKRAWALLDSGLTVGAMWRAIKATTPSVGRSTAHLWAKGWSDARESGPLQVARLAREDGHEDAAPSGGFVVDPLKVAEEVRRGALALSCPTGVSPEQVATIAASLVVLTPERDACLVAMLPGDTLDRWRELAAQVIEPFPALVVYLDASAARGRQLTFIALATSSSWQARTWWLERDQPDAYGKNPKRKARVELTGFEHLTDEQLEDLRVRAAAGDDDAG